MSIEAINHCMQRRYRSSSHKILALVLASMSNPKARHECWPSVATLARYTQLDRRTVQRGLRDLELDGEISTRAGGGRARAVYTYLFRREALPLAVVEFDDEGRRETASGAAQDRCSSGVGPPKSESLKVSERKRALLAQEFPDPEQSRMVLLSIEQEGEAKKALMRRQYEEMRQA